MTEIEKILNSLKYESNLYETEVKRLIADYMDYYDGYPEKIVLSATVYKTKEFYYYDVESGYLYTETELLENVILKDTEFMSIVDNRLREKGNN